LQEGREPGGFCSLQNPDKFLRLKKFGGFSRAHKEYIINRKWRQSTEDFLQDKFGGNSKLQILSTEIYFGQNSSPGKNKENEENVAEFFL
jgi:hypothetical protein